MTREEAINILGEVKELDDSIYQYNTKYLEALNMAIKALEQEPKIVSIAEIKFDENKLKELVNKAVLTVAPQEPRWIPVSERLPEAFSFVNCTCHSLIDDREDWVVETIYLPQPLYSPYSDWGNIPMLNCCECEVIAWMYRDIPKPYEPQESEVEE